MTQKQEVIDMLTTQGYVSRNDCLSKYITRLASIVNILKKEGWNLTGEENKGDYIYWLEKSQLKIL